MNILIVGYYDNTGTGYKLAQAVNKHTSHKAEHAYFMRGYLEYSGGHYQPGKPKIDELLDWADVVNGHGHFEPSLYGRHPDVPIVTTYHGSVYRANPQFFNWFANARGYVQTALTLDLTRYGPSWLPTPVPASLGRKAPIYDGGILKVAHAPTNRVGKNTAEIIAACEAVPGVELDVIEKVSNAECLDRKARAHLYVDQFQMGPGLNALESALMWQPVICGAQQWVSNLYQFAVGYWPFVHAGLDNLADVIKNLKESPETMRQAAHVGRHYTLKYHLEDRVARKLIKACRQAQKQGVWDRHPHTFIGSYNAVAGISD